jgi:hypothetical protein
MTRYWRSGRRPASATNIRPELAVAPAKHLISRFFGSLRPGGPSVEECAWVAGQLLPGEFELWKRMSGPDRRHSAEVARRVERLLAGTADRSVLAAALLHDCGKMASGLRTPSRVVATLVDAVIGHDEARARQWSERQWPFRSFGRYWRHPELGAAMLQGAGSEPLTVSWTLEHHRPSGQCTLDPTIAGALREADDD